MTAGQPVSGNQTVASLLSYRATATPTAPFLIFDRLQEPPGTLNYQQGWQLAGHGAAVLRACGVGRGERFAVVMDNCPEFFACWFGAALLGAVMVPVNPNSTAEDLAYFFGHARCRAVITGVEQHNAVAAAWPHDRSRIVASGAEFHRHAVSAVPKLDPDVTPRDPLAILYTSGTTSRPKGVVVTHANYLAAGYTVASALRIRSDDRWLIVLPLFHANAQYYCAMSALVSGASMAVAAQFSASNWAVQARRHEATLASLFAAPVRMILRQPERGADADNRLRVALFAQNLTDGQLVAFEQRYGCPLLQLYGMTETVAPPLMNPLHGPGDNMTLGLPTEAARVRVVDEHGGEVLPGQVGELLVGGEPGVTLMAGYLDDEAATAAAMSNGWLRTGDLVRWRSDGLIAFHDRAKDMIKRSGENVAAAEVERVVNDHSDVFECAAVGVPDPVRDEAIRVFVVRRDRNSSIPSGRELIDFCAQRLPRGKVPDCIEFVDDLPRTSVGKIRKHVLKNGIQEG